MEIKVTDFITHNKNSSKELFVVFVAGSGIEPKSGGYEPPEVPLL